MSRQELCYTIPFARSTFMKRRESGYAGVELEIVRSMAYSGTLCLRRYALLAVRQRTIPCVDASRQRSLIATRTRANLGIFNAIVINWRRQACSKGRQANPLCAAARRQPYGAVTVSGHPP